MDPFRVKCGTYLQALPDWIDPEQDPGCSSQEELLGLRSTLRAILTLRYFLWGPNLVWFVMQPSSGAARLDRPEARPGVQLAGGAPRPALDPPRHPHLALLPLGPEPRLVRDFGSQGMRFES